MFLDKPKNVWLQTQDFAQSIHNWRCLVSPSFGIGSPAPVVSPGLFNSSTVCSPFSNSPGPSPSIPTRTNGKINKEKEPDIKKKLKTPQGFSFNIVSSESVRNPAVGKNLLHSFSPKTLNNPPKNNNENAFNCSFSNQNKRFNTNMSSEFNKQINTSFVGSNLVQPVVKTVTRNSAEDTLSTQTFVFDPVILESKKFSTEIFPQSNSERQVRTSEPAKINTYLLNNKTESKTVNINNNSKLVLSQTTQLSIEEQSLVESVFDGVDADSLFDDDF